jgi:arginine exporter protein ArgO
MGLASLLAVVLIILKATGLTALAWGWCLAPFGVDILLVAGSIFLGWHAVKKVNTAFTEHGTNFNKGFDEMEKRINAAKDKLG